MSIGQDEPARAPGLSARSGRARRGSRGWQSCGLARLAAILAVSTVLGCTQDLVAIADTIDGGTGASGSSCAKANEPCDPSGPRQCCSGSWCNGWVCVGADAGNCNKQSYYQTCTNNGDCSCGGTCQAVASQGSSPNVRYCASPGAVPFEDGTYCSLPSDCRSLFCDSYSKCSTAGQACAVEGDSCNSPVDCCSNRCNGNKCTSDGCTVVGDACRSDSECCAKAPGSCVRLGNESRCMTNYCRGEGDVCILSSQCCSYNCSTDSNRCEASIAARRCYAQDSPCYTGGSCCSGICNQTIASCFALDGCQPIGESCNQNGDCCSGSCTSDGSAPKTCSTTYSCLDEGEICSQGSTTCCGGQCVNAWNGVKRCSRDPATGRNLGSTCAFGAQCESGGNSGSIRCAADAATGAFTCRNDCVENGSSCENYSDCCRGYCSSRGTCDNVPTTY
jgi:hypothetical protein